MRFSVENFGCRVNQAEASTWIEKLQSYGWKWEQDFIKSDVIIINTCTLTSKADQEARKLIRRIIRNNPKAKIVLTGCYVERAYDHYRAMPEIWAIFKNKEKEEIPDILIKNFYNERNFSIERIKHFRARAFIKIQDGCNYKCSFCIIPFVRGKSKSKPLSFIQKEIKEYINHGFKEIVLCGIHLCSYGLDLKPKSSLLELLKKLENIKGLNKLRLSSLDPRFLNLHTISYFASSPIIAPHFHLSFQSGSKKILKKMYRDSTPEQYTEILNTFSKLSPDSSLGTDIIVGFPGETEREFEETYKFLKDSPLAYFHVFPFSPRPGTPAYNFSQINGKIKKERANVLRKLSFEKNFHFRNKFINKTLKGIIIKKCKDFTEFLTYNYIKVKISSYPYLKIGEEKEIKICKVTPYNTEGKIIS
jgi:threonylcarbamoyladenosine tRNA methylthiotransferase MtaB